MKYDKSNGKAKHLRSVPMLTNMSSQQSLSLSTVGTCVCAFMWNQKYINDLLVLFYRLHMPVYWYTCRLQNVLVPVERFFGGGVLQDKPAIIIFFCRVEFLYALVVHVYVCTPSNGHLVREYQVPGLPQLLFTQKCSEGGNQSTGTATVHGTLHSI